jgi:hypothetical protein
LSARFGGFGDIGQSIVFFRLTHSGMADDRNVIQKVEVSMLVIMCEFGVLILFGLIN